MRTIPAGQSSYRLSRRGFLAAAGASAATAILAACGGTTGPATQQVSPVATRPASVGQTSPAAAPSSAAASSPAAAASPAATVQAKTGGKLVIRWWTGDPPDLDPYLNVTFRSQEFGGFFYSRRSYAVEVRV